MMTAVADHINNVEIVTPFAEFANEVQAKMLSISVDATIDGMKDTFFGFVETFLVKIKNCS